MVEHLPEALNGHVASVHQARVASRRLREALPVIVTLIGRKRANRAIRSIRQVTRALGPVRELDVTMQLLDDLASTHADLESACGVVRRLVAVERQARRTAMLHTLDRRVVNRTCRAVERVVEALRQGAGADADSWRTAITSRALRRSDRLMEAIGDAGLLFDPARLHLVRIAAKKLRYMLELATEARVVPAGKMVDTLKDSQERLGRLHDLQMLRAFVRTRELEGPPRQRASLAALRSHIERQCHREHARYLKRREQLLALCESVRTLAGPRSGGRKGVRPSRRAR
jgi:CHAD domain-containing protein